MCAGHCAGGQCRQLVLLGGGTGGQGCWRDWRTGCTGEQQRSSAEGSGRSSPSKTGSSSRQWQGLSLSPRLPLTEVFLLPAPTWYLKPQDREVSPDPSFPHWVPALRLLLSASPVPSPSQPSVNASGPRRVSTSPQFPTSCMVASCWVQCCSLLPVEAPYLAD